LGVGIRDGNNNSNAGRVNSNQFSDHERRLMERVVDGLPFPYGPLGSHGISGVNEIGSSEIFAERLQSFYPSCSVPNHTDTTLWYGHGLANTQMKLFYQITFPKSVNTRTQINVVTAKLRIYKFKDPPLDSTPNANINNLGNYFKVIHFKIN